MGIINCEIIYNKDYSQCEDYRIICFLNSAYKISSKINAERLKISH